MSINIEKDVLRYGVLAGIFYQVYQSLTSLAPDVPLNTLLINLALTATLLGLYFLAANDQRAPHCAFLVHIIALSGFTYFWANYGGLAGTVPGFLCVYLPFIVLTSHGFYRLASFSILCSLLVVYFVYPGWLGMSHYQEAEKISLVQLSIDYVVLALLITGFSIFMKNRFLFYRRQTSRRYVQLDQVVNRLKKQQLEIVSKQEEIMTINNSLETLVKERAAEIAEKNASLKEYAFINAHLLRSPICRIIGILHLMELEPEKYNAEQTKQMQEVANLIDEEIQKVNFLVGI